MIKRNVVLLGFPVYAAVAVLAETMLGSGNPASRSHAPIWRVAVFCLTALTVTVVILRYVLRRTADKVPTGHQDFYWTLLVALVVSGVVESAGKGVATVLLGGHPWWALVPIFGLGYAALWAVVAMRLTRRAENPPPAP
jgi:hypothetical protein